MGIILTFLKFVISFSLILIAAFCYNRLFDMTLSWWSGLNPVLSILVGLLIIWVLGMLVMVEGIAVSLLLNWNNLAFIMSLALFLYFAIVGIGWIYHYYNFYNFQYTKQAIVGSGAIIYHLIKCYIVVEDPLCAWSYKLEPETIIIAKSRWN